MLIRENELQKLFSGALRFQKTESGIMPLRFTEQQEKWYLKFPDFADKVRAAAGMRLDFMTDAREIQIPYTTYSGSSRKFCYFDIYMDSIMLQHCGTENREEHPDGILLLKTDGTVHHITIYLPNLAGVTIPEIDLKAATFVKPVKRNMKVLVFGDSITQGYDAHYPSLTYINRIADHFKWEIINKAVGGDTFSAEMGAFTEDFTPDRIWVAYGTNDWSRKHRDVFENDVQSFFRNLKGRFPETPLHVLLPIWREDHARETFAGTFESAREFIRNTASAYKNVQVIDGLKLLPQLGMFFEDHYLHPNDMGFLLMADGLIHELENRIKN